MKILTLLFVIFSLSAQADEVCGRSQGEINSYLYEVPSRIGFQNGGGLFDSGVCWWHSRLQRASAYLAGYAPEAPHPSEAQVREILMHLRLMDRTVVIPGFTDFESFTNEFRPLVQKLLDDWQKSDGFLNFSWARGLSGQYQLPATQMKTHMDGIYQYYQNSPTAMWLMAQIKGITAHAVLVLNMIPVDTGYDLAVIDSNRPLQTLAIRYRYGDTQLNNGLSYSYVPYVGYQDDFKKIADSLLRACGGSSMIQDMLEVKKGVIEARP